MKRLIVVACWFSIFGAGWVFGQQSAWNGTSWKTMSEFERTMYVAGFNKGHARGMSDGMSAVLKVIVAARPGSSWTPEERQRIKEKAEQIDQKSAGGTDFTMRQLEAAVSTFYGDYRNAPVCWDDAILLSTASLRRNAPTEQELVAARKSGAESLCK